MVATSNYVEILKGGSYCLKFLWIEIKFTGVGLLRFPRLCVTDVVLFAALLASYPISCQKYIFQGVDITENCHCAQFIGIYGNTYFSITIDRTVYSRTDPMGSF